jgi:hypothetical protein
MTSRPIELSRGVNFAVRLFPVYLLLFLLIAASLSPGAASPKGLLTPTLIELSCGGDLRPVLFLFLLVDSHVGVLVFLGVRPLVGMVLFLGECVDVDIWMGCDGVGIFVVPCVGVDVSVDLDVWIKCGMEVDWQMCAVVSFFRYTMKSVHC